MAKNQTRPCNTCVYWQAYPEWEGVGTCDNVLSRSYARMAIGTLEHCEYFSPRVTSPSMGGSSTPGGERQRGVTYCEQCHYWLPFETMPSVGQCDNPSSAYFGKPAFSDKCTEGCYMQRILEGQEFLWCQTHRETIYMAELPDHGSCHVFTRPATLPVEDEMELTVAGD